MKAYTDLEQSKKLAKILPIKSADLWWVERYTGIVKENGEYIVDETPFYYRSLVPASTTNYSQDIINDIPAWSLAALLDYIKDKCGYFELVYLSSTMDGSAKLENVHRLSTDGYDVYEKEAVDACYEMVVKLHKQKLL